MSGNLVCAHCNGTTPPGTAVTPVARVASTRDNPSGRPLADLSNVPRTAVFCSSRCMNAGSARALAQPTCSVCGKRFERAPGAPGGERPGPGRPAVYCGADCRRKHERDVARALKELARDAVPDRLDKMEAALGGAHTLAKYWAAGAGPAPLQPPSPRARAALRARLERLTERRGQLLEEQRVKGQTERHQAERAARARRREAGEEADKAWRAAVLQGGGA